MNLEIFILYWTKTVLEGSCTMRREERETKKRKLCSDGFWVINSTRAKVLNLNHEIKNLSIKKLPHLKLKRSLRDNVNLKLTFWVFYSIFLLLLSLNKFLLAILFNFMISFLWKTYVLLNFRCSVEKRVLKRKTKENKKIHPFIIIVLQKFEGNQLSTKPLTFLSISTFYKLIDSI